jgi:glycosyltransferase involved in cell wall biosynthesis
MKVLYIVTAYPRHEGDVITPWLVETVRRLREKEVEIVVFSSSYKGLTSHTIYGTRVVRFRYFFKKWENLTHEETAPDRISRSLFYKFLVPFYLLFGTLKVISLCRKESFDVIHVHWPVPHTIFGYAGKKVCGARLILSFYGVELRWIRNRLPWLRSLVKWSLHKADLVTCISTHTRKEVLDISTRPVMIIPFGAGLEIEEGYSVPALPSQILFVGRLVERKGVVFLIEAFKTLLAEIDCRLYILGDGPEKPILEGKVKALGLEDKVIFTGVTSEKQLRERYRNCSLLVLPAITDSKGDTEGLGVVLIESLSYKRPVVASRVGGIADIVEDEKTGLLVPEKDSRALSQALHRLLSDPILSQRLAEEGYRHVREKFAWDKIIDQIMQAYRG